MRSKLVALLFSDLGIEASHSRPRVSNDNPFSEAQFRTVKYRPDFPDRFGSIEHARAIGHDLFAWYNDAHHHSGLSYLTPADVHDGRAATILEVRHHTRLAAYAAHPERFVQGPPRGETLPTAVWINPPAKVPGEDAPGTTTVTPADPQHGVISRPQPLLGGPGPLPDRARGGASVNSETGCLTDVDTAPYADVWAACEERIHEVGLDWSKLQSAKANESKVSSDLVRTREIVLNELEPLIESRQRYLQWKSLSDRKAGWLACLDEFSRKDTIHPLIQRVRTGIKKGNYDTYCEAWQKLGELTQLKPRYQRRCELLERLEGVAELWAEAVRGRREPHHEGRIPRDLKKAWRFRQLEQRLNHQTRLDLDSLQEKLDSVAESLLTASASYVEKKAWLAQLGRTGLEQQQALTGWLGLHKKIGKGGGKHVPRLKEEALRRLVECRSAVPVWIMPLSRVTECFDLATTRFDVVILDEASQSDALGLVAFAMGREVVVVGDHEQVSPYAVGQSTDRVHALIDES